MVHGSKRTHTVSEEERYLNAQGGHLIIFYKCNTLKRTQRNIISDTLQEIWKNIIFQTLKIGKRRANALFERIRRRGRMFGHKIADVSGIFNEVAFPWLL